MLDERGNPLPEPIAEFLEELAAEDDGETLTADGFERAIIGRASWFTPDGVKRPVVYDIRKMIEILMSQELTEEEAEEYLSFNTFGAYVGTSTPIFVDLLPSE